MTVSTNVLAVCRWVVPVGVSALVLLVTAGRLPALAGVVLVAAVVAGTALLRGGVGQGAACRVLHGARAPTVAEAAVLAPALTLLCRAALGPPVVEIRVQPRGTGLLAVPWGHATVIVPRALVLAVHERRVSDVHAAASLAHAAGAARGGLTRDLPALQLWCLPWLVLAAVVAAVADRLGSMPLLRLAWHARFVVASVAVAQSAMAGRVWFVALLAGAAAASYALPGVERAWRRRVEKVGDAWVAEVGLGRLYVDLSRAAGHRVALERVAQLTAAAGTTRTGLVVGTGSARC